MTSLPPQPPVPPPLPPAAGGVPAAGVPWERQRELGFASALVETLRESLFHPVEFFRRLDPRGGIFPALLFAVLVSLAAGALQVIWEVVLPDTWSSGVLMPGEARRELAVGALTWFLLLLLLPVLVPVWVVLYSAVLHGVLLVLGGPSRGYAATLRVVSYSSGPQLLAILPFCGSLIGVGWALVLNVIGLREVHGIPTGKGVAVVLVPLLLCVIAIGAGLVVVLLVAGSAALGRF